MFHGTLVPFAERRKIIMKDSRDFKKEYEAFLKKVPYQTAVVDGVEVR